MVGGFGLIMGGFTMFCAVQAARIVCEKRS